MSPDDVEAERLRLELRLQLLETQERATTKFIDFCRYVWPEMIVGEHHRRIADALDRVIAGLCDAGARRNVRAARTVALIFRKSEPVRPPALAR